MRAIIACAQRGEPGNEATSFYDTFTSFSEKSVRNLPTFSKSVVSMLHIFLLVLKCIGKFPALFIF